MHPFNLISATCTMHASYRQATKHSLYDATTVVGMIVILLDFINEQTTLCIREEWSILSATTVVQAQSYIKSCNGLVIVNQMQRLGPTPYHIMLVV